MMSGMDEEEVHQLALMQNLRSMCNHPRLVYPALDPNDDDVDLDALEEAAWDDYEQDGGQATIETTFPVAM